MVLCVNMMDQSIGSSASRPQTPDTIGYVSDFQARKRYMGFDNLRRVNVAPESLREAQGQTAAVPKMMILKIARQQGDNERHRLVYELLKELNNISSVCAVKVYSFCLSSQVFGTEEKPLAVYSMEVCRSDLCSYLAKIRENCLLQFYMRASRDELSCLFKETERTDKDLFNFLKSADKKQFLSCIEEIKASSNQEYESSRPWLQHIVDECSGVEFDYAVEQGILPQEKVQNILLHLSSALDIMHNEKRRAHGDIKPENITLNRQGQWVLIDLEYHTKYTEMGWVDPVTGEEPTLKGTKDYLAPEIVKYRLQQQNSEDAPLQISASSIAFDLSDVYSLGLVMYEMLYGEKFPYNYMKRVDMSSENVDNVLSEQRTLKNDTVETINLQLRAALLGMLKVDPADRWSIKQVQQSFES